MESKNKNAWWLAALGIGAVAAYSALRKSRPEYDFRGKVVFITGGSRGLGLILARGFAERGARIAICARNGEALVRAVRGADKEAITDVRVFDRYRPDGGELSLALEVTLQPTDKSFTDDEIAVISKRIVGAAEKLGAKLRS